MKEEDLRISSTKRECEHLLAKKLGAKTCVICKTDLRLTGKCCEKCHELVPYCAGCDKNALECNGMINHKNLQSTEKYCASCDMKGHVITDHKIINSTVPFGWHPSLQIPDTKRKECDEGYCKDCGHACDCHEFDNSGSWCGHCDCGDYKR